MTHGWQRDERTDERDREDRDPKTNYSVYDVNGEVKNVEEE